MYIVQYTVHTHIHSVVNFSAQIPHVKSASPPHKKMKFSGNKMQLALSTVSLKAKRERMEQQCVLRDHVFPTEKK